jgi:hypothetical protein
VPRRLKIALGLLAALVLVGALYFPVLRKRVQARPERTEEQARREVTQPPIATPTDVRVKAKMFWTSANTSGVLDPVEVELALSADPVQRSKQLLRTLILDPPTPAQRSLPADVALLEFYLLPDGTGVADFSDTLATATPSGILSEQLAVDSITRTLAANVAPIRRLKILIHGQESETLAGHVDLTGFFAANPAPAAPAAPASPPAKAPSGGLTRPAAPGKLTR